MENNYYISNIKKILDHTTLSLSPQYILTYLSEIFKSLSNNTEVIDEITLYHYLKLPFFISKKIFCAFSEYNLLNEHLFFRIICGLFLGNFKEKITNIFLVLDFDQDKIIQFDDVKLIFYQLHLLNYNYSNENDFSLIDNILSNFFSNKTSLSFKEYLEIIKNENSDLIFILLLIFFKYIPFTEEQIILFNDSHNQKENKINISIYFKDDEFTQIFPPSKIVFEYCHDFLNILDLIYEDENSSDESNLDELNSFEDDWKKIKDTFTNKNLNDYNYVKAISTMNLNLIDRTAKFDKTELFNKVLNKSSTQLSKINKGYSNYIGLCKIFLDENSDEYIKNDVYLVGDNIFLFKVYGNGMRNFKIINKIIILKKVLYLSKDKKSIILNYIINQLPEYFEIYFSSEYKLNEFHNKVIKQTNYRKIDEFYIPENKIAKGTYGEIILSKKIENNEIYAVKILNKNYTISLKEQSPIYWEMDISNILSHINNQNIIKIYETFESLDHCYIVMEILKVDLLTFLHSNEINDKNKLSIIYQLSEGIYTLRKFGIIHRDLKLENIGIVDKNKIKVKLFDFGLSKIIGNNEKTNESYGSFFYFPPEVLNNQSYNYKIDIWPFGIIIYYLLFKKFPFENEKENDGSQTERVKYFIQKLNTSQIRIEEKNAKNKEQKRMYEILKKCLVKNVEKRCSINDIIYILKLK